MLEFTPAAIAASLEAVRSAEPPAIGLRITAEGGGCHGPQCSLGLEEAEEEGDRLFEFGGLKVLVDPVSLTLIEGAVVDFVTDERGSVFVFDNPAWRKRGSGGCGCGGRGHSRG